MTEALESSVDAQGTDIALLKSGLAGITQKLDEFIRTSTETIKALGDAQADTRSSNWRFLLTAGLGASAFVIIAFGGMLTIVSLNTQVQLSPIATKAEISERDRADLHKQVDDLGAIVIALKNENATTNQRFIEVETQVRSLDAVRNLETQYQQQYNALLWEKTMGTNYPLMNYSPQIGAPPK